MTAVTFDALDYFERLKAAGVPEAQAKVQAETLRRQADAQAAALQRALDKYDEASRKDLATKGDIQDVRTEIQDVRTEIQDVRNEVQDVRLEIEKVRAGVERAKYDLLKWQIGGWVALAAVMAKGFGWLGF